MRTIIAGSRDIWCYSCVRKAVELARNIKGIKITEIISGGAQGVDTLAVRYARQNKIPYKVMKAEWKKFGKKAGYVRNAGMASEADALIAVWNGKSKGTKHMIDIATKRKLQVFVYNMGIKND